MIKDGMEAARVDNFGFSFFVASAICFDTFSNTRQKVMAVDLNIRRLNGLLDGGATVDQVIGKHICHLCRGRK